MEKNRIIANNVSMPIIGYGTFKIDNAEVEQLVLKALEVGYRHIDTATLYENEEGVGNALSKTSIKREDIFLTTKIANHDQGYDETLAAVEASLKALQVDYIDLILIHWPNPKSAETWKALEEVYAAGKARAIGLSNFHKQHLDKLKKTWTVVPHVNQIEHHPFLIQRELEAVNKEFNIPVQAWSPLARGDVFSDETLKQLAEKYQVSLSQIVMRWQIQSGWLVVVKASTSDRMAQNLNVFDFELSEQDMKVIDGLDRNFRSGSNPDDFPF